MSEVQPASELTPFQQQVTAYRQLLQTMEQQQQSEYDKAVMLLSGGALGISMTFLKEIVGMENLVDSGLILGAWLCWAVSSASVAFSFSTSASALRNAISQTDAKILYLNTTEMGGRMEKVTRILNPCAGFLFVIGVALMMRFAWTNVTKHMPDQQPQKQLLNEGALVPMPPSIPAAKTENLTQGAKVPQPPPPPQNTLPVGKDK